MIVDSSAPIAILMGEPEGRLLDIVLVESQECCMPAAGFLEASMVLLARKGPEGPRNLDLLMARLGVRILPFTESQARLALQAFARFGKGRHPAQLNFGDCIAYSLAKESGEELLFKGTDFARTDVAIAPY